MRRHLDFSLLLLGLSTAAARAQSNEFMDELLGSAAITTAQASYLVLAASERIDADAEPAAAFARAQELGWAPKAASAEDPIRYSAYAYLLARSFELKGGVMYSLFRSSPRYAYRELVARRMIQGRSDPQGKVDGLAAVRVLGRVVDASVAAASVAAATGRAK
jgi:hypothetical protein